MISTNHRRLLTMLCLLLALGPASLFAGAGKASAQVMRVAIVNSMKGTVTVLKSGGAKPFAAFKNMSLNEGDQIATSNDGNVVLQLASDDADKDSVTIGPSSQVTFTKLKESSGTKTKMSVWAGSLWVKVKSVSNANDQFEVETPTSIMGVRGTQFFVGVNPRTGLTSVFLAAGVIEAITGGIRLEADGETEQDDTVTLYPTEQLDEANTADGEGLMTSVSIMDITKFINNASPDIIKAILEDAANIRKEQDEMLKKAKDSIGDPASKDNFGGTIKSAEDLQTATNNITNLLSILAAEAVDQKKIDKTVIDQINQDAKEKLLDLDTTAKLMLSDADKLKQKTAEELEEKQKKLGEAKEKQLQEQKEKLAAAVKKAKEQQAKLAEENRKALDELTKKLELLYFEKLTKAEQDKFNTSRGEIEKPPIKENNTGSNNSGSPTTTNALAKLKFNQAAYATSPLIVSGSNGAVDLELEFSGFSDSRKIKGYQIEIEYDSLTAAFNTSSFDGVSTSLSYRSGGGGFVVEPEGQQVSGANSVDDFRIVEGETSNTLVYTVAKFSGDSVQISNATSVLKLPFLVRAILPSNEEIGPDTMAAPVHFRIKSITAVDAAGVPVATVKGPELTLQVKPANN
ncbi:FecR domain-containing protein [Paenibacillus sp. CF384]|uniref:FecR family protein n=1 Tax=Paenibacillus sp. CF384 TaxID=1884382 RepID=UPI00089A560D|nr:FecR domain-containing protein [Paenibacillus sp. CF384]SDW53891.1 FecR family protein [Paenibacillus sp. CF384]